jgi:hypothetical protein
MEISKNGYTFYIERLEIETDKQLIQRSWFIVNQLNEIDNENLAKDFEKAVRLSRIWHNIKNLKCEYHTQIMDIIANKQIKHFC